MRIATASEPGDAAKASEDWIHADRDIVIVLDGQTRAAVLTGTGHTTTNSCQLQPARPAECRHSRTGAYMLRATGPPVTGVGTPHTVVTSQFTSRIAA